jgi:hypothetical protein
MRVLHFEGTDEMFITRIFQDESLHVNVYTRLGMYNSVRGTGKQIRPEFLCFIFAVSPGKFKIPHSSHYERKCNQKFISEEMKLYISKIDNS